MVKAALSLFLLLLTTGCSSESDCTKGSEFEPPLCPSEFTKVAVIKIHKNAATHPVEKSSETNCNNFILKNDSIKRYFELAKVTNENDAHHTLDWSPCFASGEIEFQNGKKASWEINQSRLGQLTFANGKKEILYCADCKFLPFY